MKNNSLVLGVALLILPLLILFVENLLNANLGFNEFFPGYILMGLLGISVYINESRTDGEKIKKVKKSPKLFNSLKYNFKKIKKINPFIIIRGMFSTVKKYFSIKNKTKRLKMKATKKNVHIKKQDVSKDVKNSMLWCTLMTYLVIPLILLFCISTLKMWGGVLTGIIIILSTILILGLHMKMSWAPDLLIFFIYTYNFIISWEYFNYKKNLIYDLGLPNITTNVEGLVFFTILFWIFWSIPNHIYFNKRKHLFIN